MSAPYHPRRGIRAAVRRRLIPRLVQRNVALTLTRPTLSFTFDDVPDSVAANALPRLEARAWPATLYIASALMGETNHHGRNMDVADLRATTAAGHELGAHSHTHADLSRMNAVEVNAEFDRNHAKLGEICADIRSFAYPYGEADVQTKRLAGLRYASSRGIHPGIHADIADLNQLRSFALFSRTVDGVIKSIEALGDRPAWMTLFTHDVSDHPTPWGCTPAELQRVIDAASHLDVRSVGDVVTDLKAAEMSHAA